MCVYMCVCAFEVSAGRHTKSVRKLNLLFSNYYFQSIEVSRESADIGKIIYMRRNENLINGPLISMLGGVGCNSEKQPFLAMI